MVNLQKILLTILMLISSLALFTGFEKDAEAGEFVIFGSGSFLEYQNIAMTNEYVSGNEAYYGGIAGFQPEYRFARWFGLGLDIGFGGGVADSKWASYDGTPSHVNTMVFETYLTFKFIAPLNYVDIWAELGTGTFGLIGDFMLDDGEWYHQLFQWASRARVGLTINIHQNIGIGLHFAAIYRFITDGAFEAGLHFNYHFGK